MCREYKDRLCVSLLFDKSSRVCKPDDLTASPTPLEYNILLKQEIQVEVQSFKDSLAVDEAAISTIEMDTREQCESLKWFHYRRFRITASYFGAV